MSAIEQLPEELADPLLIFDGGKKFPSRVILTEQQDLQGKPIVVALHLQQREGRLLVNRIASAYGKDNVRAMQAWIKEGRLRYQSDRSPAQVRLIGLQLPQSGSLAQGSEATSPVLKGLQLPNSVSGKTSPNPILDEAAIQSSVDENPSIRFSRSSREIFEDIQAQVANRPTIGEYIKHKIEDWRPGWLGALTRLHLADIAKNILPAAKSYVREAQQMDADRNHLLSESAEIAQRWGKYQRKFKAESRNLADLMHDATVAGTDPAEDFKPLLDITGAQQQLRALNQQIQQANTQTERERLMTKQEKLKIRLHEEQVRLRQYPLLKARYQSLSEDGKAIYKAVRDHYHDRSKAVYQALVERLDRAQVSGEERAKLKTKLRLRFESARVTAPYFPLARFGDYWVQVKEGPQAGFYMFESTQAQSRFARQQQTQGHAVAVGKSLENIRAIHGASEGFLSEVMGILNEAGVAQSSALRDSLYQLYLTTLPELSARKHFIHRKKTKGYSQDALRAFAKQTFHGAYQLAHLQPAISLSGSWRPCVKVSRKVAILIKQPICTMSS
jgi:hypothetical protein